MEAYFCLFNPENIQEPKFKSIKELIPEIKIDSQMLPQNIISNSTHLIWLRYDQLIIIPLNRLVTNNSTLPIISISSTIIGNYLKLKDNTTLLIKSTLIPIILTKYHVILSSISNLNHREIDADFLIAFCLNNGEIAMIKQFNFLNIKYLSYGPDIDSFLIVSYQCVLKSSFKNENSPTLIKPINQIKSKLIEKLNFNKFITPTEIFYNLFKNNNFNDLIKFIDIIIENKKNSNLKINLLQYLLYEILILNYFELNFKFLPFKIEENKFSNEVFNKIIYLIQIRSFSSINFILNSNSIYETNPYSEKSIRLAIKNGFYDLILNSIKINSPFINDIAIKSPQTISKNLINWSLEIHSNLLIQILPFLIKFCNIKSLIYLFKNSINESKFLISTILLWAICLENDSYLFDEEINNFLNLNNYNFYDIIYLIDICKRNKLYKTSCNISIKYNLLNEAIKISKFFDQNLTNELKLKLENNIKNNNKLENQNSIQMNKEEIVQQLENILTQVSKLTNKATEDANLINQEIFLKPLIFYNNNNICSICNEEIKNTKSYCFICQHSFHYNCLNKYLKELLSKEDLLKLIQLELNLNENIKEIDEFLLQDCPLCGLICTNIINKPITKKLFPLAF